MRARSCGRIALSMLAVSLLLACEAAVAPGAPCVRPRDCSSPLVCAVGHCRAACRESRDCRLGQHCIVDPTTAVPACSLDVDACADHVCPIGFVCQDGECLNACGLIVACPDRLCVDGACIPQRGDEDAAVGDAGGPCHGPRCDPVVQIDSTSQDGSADLQHVCARTRGGSLWCWGDCALGECGDRTADLGTCGCTGSPVRALDETGSPFADVIDVALTATATCVVRRTSGEVWCWGSRDAGVPFGPAALLLPDGTPLRGVTDIDGGADHACALRGEGTQPLCFGTGENYRLGTGTTVTAETAVVATELPAASVLRLDARHTMVLDASGAVVGVGANDTLELGALTPTSDAITAVTASFPPPVRDFDTHTEWTGAILADGRLATCGTVDDVLGPTPTPAMCTLGPTACSIGPAYVAVPSGLVLVGIAMGAGAGVVWAEDGSLWGWGSAVTPPAQALVRMEVGARVVAATMFHASVCVLTDEGDVLCAGENDRGMLGRGAPGAYDPAFGSVVWPE